MLHVLNGIGSLLPDARKLFAGATVLGACALVLGYMEYHDRTDRDMALEKEPPAAVALQNFNTSRHTGLANEVQVHAEAGFDQAITLSVPGTEGAERALVAPLFPLSEVGQALIEAQSDGAKTALTAQVARRTGDSSADRPAAIGFLYHPLDAMTPAPEDPSVLAVGMYGNGLNGQVVTLNGWAAEPGDLGLMAAGAFAAQGTSLAGTHMAIEPFAEGRLAALAALPDSQVYLAPAVFALLLALLGTLAALRGQTRARDQEVAYEDFADVEDYELDGHTAHPKFAPIPSQREIVQAAESRVPDEPNWVLHYGALALRGFWQLLRMLGSGLMFCARALRNRLSPREDEVL